MKKISLFLIVCFLASADLAQADCALQEYELRQAASSSRELVIEHTKLVTMDATTFDPGQVEVDFIYSVQGGSFAWGTNGKRKNRREILNQNWNTETYIGLFKNIDIGIFQGFSSLMDRENNYNELAGVIDPGTGEEMEDPTEGPFHGGGIGDLGITGRWRFYHNEEKKLEIAYNPTVIIPTGRRSNLDHLGPSQGYTSLTNALVFTKDIKRFTGNFSAGYTVPLAHSYRTGNSAGGYDLNLAIGYQVFSWLQPAIEVLWAQGFEKHGKGAKILSIVAGVIMPVHKHIRLDLGIQQDIAGSNVDQMTSGIFKIALLT